MTLSPTELLTLAGLLRALVRFDTLEPEARREALDAVARTLDLRSGEPERPQAEQVGYRDAARVVRVLVLDLEPWMARAERELRDPEELRALVSRGADSPENRRAILRALHTFAEHGNLTLREEIFLAWLALLWRETPMDPGAYATTSLDAIPKTDRLVLGGLLARLLEISDLDEAGKAQALDAAANVLATTSEKLTPWIAQAAKEIRGESHLRGLASFGVTSPRSREAIVRALLAASYVGGIEPKEEAFLHWLAAAWSMV